MHERSDDVTTWAGTGDCIMFATKLGISFTFHIWKVGLQTFHIIWKVGCKIIKAVLLMLQPH